MIRSRVATRHACSLILLPVLLLSPLLVLQAAALDPDDYADLAFQRTWERTDKPVEDGAVPRTWVWGAPVTGAVEEPYVESPEQSRLVQYFDKTRMEITDPNGDQNSIWYVTNGLLVVELMSGLLQSGNNAFAIAGPADVNVAGDPLDPDAVTYADLAALTFAPPLTDGATITQRVDAEGLVTDDPSLASHAVTAAHRLAAPGIDHQIASVFWDYMNSTGLVWENSGYTTTKLFPDPYYATGYPKTEPYWTNVDVGGADTLVLLQCFERRCLTYTPTNAPEWQVEMGNVGLHYHTWRYTPAPPADDALYVGYLGMGEQAGAQSAPRKEPNINPVPGGTVSIAPGLPGTSDFAVAINADGAGEVTGYEIRYEAPGGPPRTMLSRSFPEGTSNLGSLTDGFNANELPSELPEDPVTADEFNGILASGNITILVKTTELPDGLRAVVTKPDELVFGLELKPAANVESQGFGSFTGYYNPAEDHMEFSVLTAASSLTGAYLLWDDADGEPVYRIDLTPPQLFVPTGSVITGEDVSAQIPGGTLTTLAQQFVSGNVNLFITTLAHPNGELTGTSFPLHPDYQPTLHFYVHSPVNLVPPVENEASGTGVMVWDTLERVRLLVTSADLPGVTGVNIHQGIRGQNGQIIINIPVVPADGEVNGVLFDRSLTAVDLGISIPYFIYLVDSQQTYMTQTTAALPNGAIRGQGQYPSTLDPYALYIAQAPNEACRAESTRRTVAGGGAHAGRFVPSECEVLVTLLFFFSGNQATYGGEAIVWDMLCRGIDVEDEDEVEEAGIFLEEVDLLLAELVAEEMSDRKNGNGSCGNGSITLTGQYGRPWEGPYEYWPTEGWSQAGANLWVHVETEHERMVGMIEELWVSGFLGN